MPRLRSTQSTHAAAHCLALGAPTNPAPTRFPWRTSRSSGAPTESTEKRFERSGRARQSVKCTQQTTALRRLPMPRVIHFEIHAEKPERAVAFYSKLFGWEFTKWGGPMEYYLVKTGPDGQPGINGGMIKR